MPRAFSLDTMAWSKESRQSRGYGAAWDKLRERIMQRDYGICQYCYRSTGRVHKGNEVDHIISKAKARKLGWTAERMDHESNLQCIATECHKIKTALETGKTVKRRVGADGWYIED